MSNRVPRMPGWGCHRLPAWEVVCVCVCVRVHMRVSALCLHVYTHMHVWLCVQKPTCAQACGPSATQVQVPKGPHPRTLGCAAHTALNFTSAGGRPPLSHLGTSPAAPQVPGPAGSTRAPRWGQDVTSLPGDAHRPSLSGGSGQLEAWSCTCSPLGPRCNRPPGGHTQAVPQWGVRFIPV